MSWFRYSLSGPPPAARPGLPRRARLVLWTLAAALGGPLLAVVGPAQHASADSSIGGPITRSEVISRARYWLTLNLTYDQSGSAWDVDHSRQYRTDCSGMIDMAWHLGADPNTDALPGYAKPISGSELQPGDLLDYISGPFDEHHAVLFEAWESDHVHFSYLSFGHTPMTEYTHATLSDGDNGSGLLAGHPVADYQPYEYTNIVDDGSSARPAVVRDADGRLEAFYHGADGQLWHAWQLNADGTGGWSSPAPLGGHVAGSPAVALNADGRAEVFFRGTDGQLWHTWQLAANGAGGWGGPAGLGGALANDGDPAVATDADGRLEVFFHGSSGSLWHLWENGVNGAGGWSAPVNLGGWAVGVPATAINTDGRVEVFFHGGDGQLWHTWQLTANGAGGWGGPAGLGGSLGGDPAVGTNAGGRLEAFYRDSGSTLYHLWQGGPGQPWSSPQSLSGSIAP